MSKSKSTYDVDFLRRIEDTTLNDQELARNAEILNDIKLSDSEINIFFKDKCVLLTGATGFLGKVLLEKLLRSCPNIKAIFLLIREKNSKNVQERMSDFFKQTVFDRLRKQSPNFTEKIHFIKADIAKLDLGLSEEDREKIKQEVSVIFHAAAADRYNDSLNNLVLTNVRGTAEILRLAYGCGKLTSMVYFSTAYSSYNHNKINEDFNDVSIKAEDVINIVQNNIDTEKMIPGILEQYPDIFTFTKVITENLIRTHGTGIPVCILRSSNIVATYREPLRGWIDNLNGVSSILVGSGLGLIHSLHCDPSQNIDIVPVDMVANVAIVSSWRTSLDGLNSKGPTVYNYVSSCQKPISWDLFHTMNQEYVTKLPTLETSWYYSFNLRKCRYMHLLVVFFLHYLKAYFMEVLHGKHGLLMMFNQIQKITDNLTRYMKTDWKFSNNNVENLWNKLNVTDKHVFNFNIALIEWERHAETYFMGLRVYFLKDPATTLKEARERSEKSKYSILLKGFYVILLLVMTIYIHKY